ncbi:hypothetical protein SD37_11825 [Amycolatopsis orientalis]|uniref:Helix-turn-helix domain-containing protein n=1 Tax=Amycolatopsis orientalis TaxID=31958 RepID=A0A193BVL7_AMYOR|nr:hypothetical protein [Amycolatopsis orientalis]ANN16267.1 hypothetical protein SD37_11825 [Amycolatopsis orientalis]
MPGVDDLARTLVTAYEAGATIEALAEVHDVTYRAVRDRLLAAGVTLRPAKILIPPCPEGMVNLYEHGASIRQVGAKFGHSYNQTRRMLLAAGVTLRPHGRVNYVIGKQRSPGTQA